MGHMKKKVLILEGEGQNALATLCHTALKGLGLEALEAVKSVEKYIVDAHICDDANCDENCKKEQSTDKPIEQPKEKKCTKKLCTI